MRQARGRPPHAWAIASDAEPGGRAPRTYQDLGRWLARALRARAVVHENQPAICALHKWITRGLLDVLEPGARLTGFGPDDPDKAGCLIKLRGVGSAVPAN